jgi:hypothetical protein
MRFLIASDFLRDENAGAAGAILDIGRALADRGHGIDYLWKQALQASASEHVSMAGAIIETENRRRGPVSRSSP